MVQKFKKCKGKGINSEKVSLIFFIQELRLLRLGTIGSLIEFKHMVVLTNETQTMLFFLRIFKFNATMYLNSIGEPDIPNLRNCT